MLWSHPRPARSTTSYRLDPVGCLIAPAVMVSTRASTSSGVAACPFASARAHPSRVEPRPRTSARCTRDRTGTTARPRSSRPPRSTAKRQGLTTTPTTLPANVPTIAAPSVTRAPSGPTKPAEQATRHAPEHHAAYASRPEEDQSQPSAKTPRPVRTAREDRRSLGASRTQKFCWGSAATGGVVVHRG